VWAFDFQFDQTADGQIPKLLHVVDEFTREALEIKCARRLDADATVVVLERLSAARGRSPEFVRRDNGPEMTANALRDWCRFSGAGASYIDPGSPWQNPYVESFGSRVRDELLAVEQFSCLAEAQVLIEDWRQDYNEHRPHSALGMLSRFAKAWRAHSAQRRYPYPSHQQTATDSHSRWTHERGPVTIIVIVPTESATLKSKHLTPSRPVQSSKVMSKAPKRSEVSAPLPLSDKHLSSSHCRLICRSRFLLRTSPGSLRSPRVRACFPRTPWSRRSRSARRS
jgi:putative transposase